MEKPTECEVYAEFNSSLEYKQLMDISLRKAYPLLPVLRYYVIYLYLYYLTLINSFGSLKSWNNEPIIGGLVMWNQWKDQLLNPNMKYAQ